MYAPAVIAAREALAQAHFPQFAAGVPRYALDESAFLTAQVMDAVDETGTLVRALTAIEQDFIAATQLRCMFDFPYFAERFCNPPEAPIWMADMTVRPSGEVEVGDLVVGWAPLGGMRPRGRATGKQKVRDTLTPSRVVAKQIRRAPIVKVHLASGRMIRCTADHQWRRGRQAAHGTWTSKAGVRRDYDYPWTTAKVGRQLSFVLDPALLAPPQTAEDFWLAGWLGGIFDGEGSWTTISQSRVANPLVYDRIAQALRHFGLPFTADADGFVLVGGRETYTRFQALARSHKGTLLQQIFSASFGHDDQIVAVESDGAGDVVSLQTTTGNYVAWGYASKNCWIDQEGHGLRRLYPLWESQRFVLDVLGRLEEARYFADYPDGLFLNILKARQLGVSTLAEALVAHRLLTRPHIRALAGADVEDQAGYLFRMVDRLYQQLPWFLQPARLYFTKNREMTFSNQSFLKTAWGKSTRGALQAITGQEGTKGAIGRGQSQPLDAKILTPTGWRCMGEIRPGDFVIGSSGTAVRVRSLHPQGECAIYRVAFTDGSSTECTVDHLWSVATASQRHRGQLFRPRPLRSLHAPSRASAHRHFIPITEPVCFATTGEGLLLDPYLIGVLLGDGCLRQAVGLSTTDAELLVHVRQVLPAAHQLVRRAKHDWAITGTNGRNYVRQSLTTLGLAGVLAQDKYIPTSYLLAPSPSDRQALLQGLLDTDGSCDKEGRVTFYTTSAQLADDVTFLVQALGGIVRRRCRTDRRYVHKGTVRFGLPLHVLTLCLPEHVEPFRLDRKQRRVRRQRKYLPARGVVSIDYVGRKLAQCISVDAANGLYLTDSCIVTHNTYSVIHISELATWENPEQLDTALLPTIPYSLDSLVIFESTAEFAGDWWHLQWQTAAAGEGRFVNVFIPWYAEPGKYALPAPADWSPSALTRAHAEKCERDSPKWTGRWITLSRDQLYWYERTRAYYTAKGELHKFLKEYPADDQECFQYAGRAIFTFEQLEAIDAAGSRRPLLDVWRVEPAREIAELRRVPPDSGEAVAPAARRRPDPPLTLRVGPVAASIAHDAFPVPPGYGFSRVSPAELKALPSLRSDVFAIWEYPRIRGPRRYVVAADVGEGLGLDYSIVDVIRLPTIEEPGEQVAQFCSNHVDTKALAFIIDAIGRFYGDADRIEALAAIETNGPGLSVQDTLQLHLGYGSFYVWEYADSASPDRRYSTKIGWVTNSRTRPLLIAHFYAAVTNVDPITGTPEYILNSPITRGELRHFVTEGTIGDAEAARGQRDDAVMAAAIGEYVSWRLAGGETEPIAERRARRAAQHALRAHDQTAQGKDWRNTAVTAEEMDHGLESDDEFADDLDTGGSTALHFDARRRIDLD